MADPVAMRLATEVRAARKSHEPPLTQKEVAERSGYSQVAISKIERGDFFPATDALERLVHALGSPPGLAKILAEARSSDPAKGPAISAAIRKTRSNARRRKDLERRQELLSQRMQPTERSLQNLRDRAFTELVEPTIEILRDLEGWRDDSVQELLRKDASLGATGPDLEFSSSSSRAALAVDLAEVFARTATGAAAGVGAAGAIYTAVGAYATASTGTAIASLSGAAATNATLAFLGGGSLAAGGFGVAGGTVALGGIVAAPALLAGAVAMTVAGRKLLDRAKSDEDRINLAEEKMFETEQIAAQVERHTREIEKTYAEALQDDVAELDREVRWLESWRAELPVDGPVSWESLDPKDRDRLSLVVGRLAVVLQLMNLPVAASAIENDSDDLRGVIELIRQANDEIIDSSRAWLREASAELAGLTA